MKTTLIIILGIACVCTAMAIYGFSSKHQDKQPMLTFDNNGYEKAWRTIDSLEDQGLTKSALEKLEELYKRAVSDNNPAQIIKTILYRGKYQSRLEEYGLEKAIQRFEEETEKAAFPLKPILQSMQAEMYTNYLSQNRYKFNDRTETVDFATGDVTTWTIRQLNEKAVQLYLASVENEETKRVPLTNFQPIVSEYNTQDFYPTLFDFLTNRAVDFFANDRTYLTQPAYQFYLDQAEAFAPAKTFVSHKFETKDEKSLKYLNLLRFQDWLKFHLNDDKQDALIHIDLKRLDYTYKNAIHPDKESLYKTALEQLQKKYAGNPAAAEISYRIAKIYQTNGNKYKPSPEAQYQFDLKTAIEICQEAIKQHPKSYGATQCQQLINQIEQKSINFNIEKVNSINQPILAKLTYKNVEKINLKLIQLSKDEYNTVNEMSQEEKVAFLQAKNAIKSWQENLPTENDYQTHAVELKIPAVKNGIYCLLSSNTAAFNQIVNTTFTYVSDISFINTRIAKGQEFYLRDRTTGAPLEGVKAEAFVNEYQSNTRKYIWQPAGTFTSDKNGHLVVKPQGGNGRNFRIKFNYKQDELYLDDNYYYYSYGNRDNKRYFSTTYFTDRAIYRPGQTIYFKGIVLDFSADKRMPSIKTGYSTTVTLYDTNGQKVEDIQVTSNEYGTYSGSFTAPTSGLLGRMSLRDNSNTGSHSFRVEEYKRPKFEVEFLPVKESYKLNDEVSAKGEAKAYAGSNIDGAKVSYRVVRQTRFPYWSYWRWGWYNPWQREDMEITNGYTQTDEKGEFEIKFQALPDRSIPQDKKPQFSYKIIADVIDITGETHSSTTYINVGYIALNADILVPESVNLDSLKSFAISTKNLNGEFEPAEGDISITKLVSPSVVYNKRFWDAPDQQIITEANFKEAFPNLPFKNEDQISNWKKGSVLFTEKFNTQNEKTLPLKGHKWTTGSYEIKLKTKDKYGKAIEIIKHFTVFDPKQNTIANNDHLWQYASRKSFEPGDTYSLSFGSKHRDAYFLYEVIHDGEIVLKEWIKTDKVVRKQIKIEEKHRGNLFYRISLIKNNRAYLKNYTIQVPWSNKDLTFEYSTFRDKLLPGQKEEWTIKLKGPKGEKVAAEMLAGMYDASLDAFAKNNWNVPGYPYNQNVSNYAYNNSFSTGNSRNILNNNGQKSYTLPARNLPYLNWFGFEFNAYSYRHYARNQRSRNMPMTAAPMIEEEGASMSNDMEMTVIARDEIAVYSSSKESAKMMAAGAPPPPPAPEPESAALEETPEEDLGEVKVRTNLNETVFFFPKLQTDAEGNVLIKFTMNEALTRWNFMGFAHTKDFKYGFTNKEIVTQKDLMVMPNPPRFLREDDVIHFTAKVSNLSEAALSGTAKLELYDALSMQPIDTKLGNTKASIPFSAKQGQSAPLSWKLSIPKGTQAVTYRVIAKAGNFSDGEESTLPVLTNRMMVTETMPLPVRGLQTKKFTFNAMKKAGESTTLSHHRMTLEFTENPAWYAIQALPYLMEYPYDCTEQVFSRYYANSLASSVANSHPKIKRVFEAWKGTDAMLSNLSKNQELKTALLEETPWVLDAQNEEQQKRRIGLLFDLNKMANEKNAALKKISERQLSNGGFSWFPGGRDSWYITQYLVEGLGHLDRLGVQEIKEDSKTQAMVSKAVNYTDDRIAEQYQRLLDRVAKKQAKLEDNNLNRMAIHYLYSRSFFLDNPVKGKAKTAMDYYVGQAERYWLDNSLYMQGMLALTLHRLDKNTAANKIVRSLKENSLNKEEFGMYWKYNRGYYWYQLPIETHSLMIEVFDEVANDAKAVDDLKVWLLKNKQTTNWKTTKATAAAVYAMLLRGDNWLVEDKPIEIKFSGKKFDASKIKKEAGTGYFKTSWNGDEVTNRFEEVEVTNPNKVVAWGALYWQYFENLDKIKTFEDTPLQLKKQVFREENTATGPVIRPVTTAMKLAPGDKLKVRIELRVDRDMEYVHMKDMRASGFEPINVLSQYKWQGGLGYYESTRDAATNFFFAYLPKGTYVFEYPLRVNHKGDFSNGITTIQSMYAPEFTSHSEGVRIQVE